MKICVENSTWSNIGDGFYQTSLLHHITKLFPEWEVFNGEGPVARTFNVSSRFRRNSIELMEYQKADIYVFSGPMLRQLTWRYANMIEKLVRQGKSYAIFSCSAADASASEVRDIKKFFEKYPPLAVSFRDDENYKEISKSLKSSISSICAAFMLREVPIAELDLGEDYIVSNFYSIREPGFCFSQQSGDQFELKKKSEFMGLPRKISRHFDWLLPSVDKVNGMPVLRVRHEPLMKFGHLYYREPFSFCGMNPLSLLSAYNGSKFVISDRVHACVAGLALGAAAHLVAVDNRSKLFTQCGIVDHGADGFMRLNLEKYEAERDRLLNFIGESLK